MEQILERLDREIGDAGPYSTTSRLKRYQSQFLAAKQPAERIQLEWEIAKLNRQIREEDRPPERPARPLTPAQQARRREAGIERQIDRLRADQAKAVAKAPTEEEKKHVQNMYDHRRERLMDELRRCL